MEFSISTTLFLTIIYLSPQEDHNLLFRIMTKATESAGSSPCIIMGDMNARLGTLTNDTLSNTRGNKLAAYMGQYGLTVRPAEQGRFTLTLDS
jgi:Endonuclease-reverse transcriptase